MKRISLITYACLLMLMPASINAQGIDIEVRPAGKELIATEPRMIVTIPFHVTNSTGKRHEFISEVRLPEEWVLITEDFPFHLDSNETTTKIVGFLVPETTSAGRYKISYIVTARMYPTIFDFYTIDVTVLPRSKVEKLPETSQSAIAGEDYEVGFLVDNESNKENVISLSIDSSENIPLTAGVNRFRFGPDQPGIITVTVKPDAKITKPEDSNSVSSADQSGGNLKLISRPKDAKELIETEPRKIVTTALRITNSTDRKREFISEVKLPEGWTLVTKDLPFELNPNASDIKLVSFFVPQATLVGKYKITYIIRDSENPSDLDAHTIYVEVLPLIKLEAKLLDIPEVVIADQDYQASFVIVNQSNTENTLRIKIDSGNNLPFTVDADTFRLAAGESKRVNVTVNTNTTIKKIFRHRLQLTVEAVEEGKIKASAKSTGSVEVLPRVSGVQDTMHRIPTELTFRYVSRKNGERESGFQTEFSGKGTLDEEGEQHIKFRLRGPDIIDKSVFGKRDEYFISHWTEYYELHFGDRGYSLSSLTENYLYGRGFEGRLNIIGGLSLGAYQMETRWHEPAIEETAAYIDYLINDKYMVGLNYLRKNEDTIVNNIVSVEGEFKPFNITQIDLEYAQSSGEDSSGEDSSGEDSKGNAYLAKVYGDNNWLNYYLKLTHGDPDYQGKYGDSDYVSGGLIIPAETPLRLNASFRRQENNLDLDPLFYSAPLEKYYQLGLDYDMETNTNLSLDWISRNRRDQLDPPDYHYQENTWKFRIGQSFKKLVLRGSVELGETESKLNGTISNVERYNAAAHFTPTNRQSYSAYFNYDNTSYVTLEDIRTTTVGGSVRYRITNRTIFNLSLQTYENSYSSGTRDTLDIGLSHIFINKSKLSMHARQTKYKILNMKDDTNFIVQYTIPFDLPVARKKNIGSVKGCVYDKETLNPIHNAILRINGSIAVTDKSGNFTFPSVKPGRFYLTVDTASIGMNRIPSLKTPIALDVRGGEKISVTIPVTRAAQLSGKVMVYGYKKNGNGATINGKVNGTNGHHYVVGNGNGNGGGNGNGDKLVEDHGLANTIVELRKNLEIIRTITDNQGRFEFEEMRPGNWILKVYDDNLPEYHYLEKDILEIELAPGEKKEMLIKALPRKRTIRIIEQGETLIEEEEK